MENFSGIAVAVLKIKKQMFGWLRNSTCSFQIVIYVDLNIILFWTIIFYFLLFFRPVIVTLLEVIIKKIFVW